jgi:hypothetical protein
VAVKAAMTAERINFIRRGSYKDTTVCSSVSGTFSIVDAIG